MPPAAVQLLTRSFRRFVALLLPNNPLVPIPQDDELYTTKVGFDLKDVQLHRVSRRRARFSSARRSQDRQPLGDHLFQVRHRLRPRAAHRHGM